MISQLPGRGSLLNDRARFPVITLFILTAILVSPGNSEAAQPVTAVPSDVGATITVGDQPFAEYRQRSGYQPVIWPIAGPSGVQFTRSYPVGPLLAGEVKDHPHHRSLWFSHGDVNGLDFWSEFDNATPQQAAQHPVIAHRKFLKIGQAGACAVVVAENDWMHQGTRICADVRTVLFGADEEVRWIDFTIELQATDRAVTFGDTKEGTFGIRVPGTMKVDAGQGGQIINSNGLVDQQAWGHSAAWVDYRGPIGGETKGITILNHPSSFRYPTRWHVRSYGLFAANPFGEQEFPPEATSQGKVTLPVGETIRLRYLVLLHQGSMDAAKLQQYAQSAGLEIE